MKKSIFFIIFSLLLSSCSFAKKDDKMMSSNDIINLINKGEHVQIFDKIITDDLNFTKVQNQAIDGNANLTHIINSDIVFVKCVFLGKVFAYNKDKITHKTRFEGDVTFRTCDFRATTDFTNAVFNGNLNMSQSKFREKATFNGIHVKGSSTHFWEMLAEKDFNMIKSLTNGSLNFMDAHFQGMCNLQGTDCNNLQFSTVQCDSTLDLSLSSFRGKVMINYGEFNGLVSLSDCQATAPFDIINCQFSDLFEINNTTFWGKTRFNSTKFKSNVEADNCYFLSKPNLENMEINKPFHINILNSSQIEIK